MNDNNVYVDTAKKYIKKLHKHSYLLKDNNIKDSNSLYEIHEIESTPGNYFHNILDYALTAEKAQQLVDECGESFGKAQDYYKKDNEGNYNIGSCLYGDDITITQTVFKKKVNCLDLTNASYNNRFFDL